MREEDAMWPAGDPTKYPGPRDGGLRTRGDALVIALVIVILALILVPLVTAAIVE
jgi:hypothetical protein